MRRLDLKPKKKLRNPGRHLRALRRWADGFKGHFPDDNILRSGERYWSWRVPIFSKLVTEPHTSPAIRSAVIQCLVDAATYLHAARPVEYAHMPVAALIVCPKLFWSEVTLFIDPEYFYQFNPENFRPGSAQDDVGRYESKTSSIDIIDHYGISLPEGARAGGYLLRITDFENPEASSEEEHWTVGFW